MSKIFERLLEHRGVDEDFLLPKYDELADPMTFIDMDKAVARITKAVDDKEKVLIYGDYDADGITSSTLMFDTLMLAGITEIEVMLPNRFKDGYGMNEKIIQKAVEGEFSLVITVDCGSGNEEIISKLKEKNIDTIVTDHHECPEELPGAVAVINPKRQGSPEKIRGLAGVGVAFMVAKALALNGKIKDGQEKWLLDLVAIGTICDGMVLRGENRRLVYFGMKVLEKTRRVGLRELIISTKTKKINSEAVGFRVGPRLNAAGRMDSAEIALKLLMTKSKAEAATLMNKINELNEQRKIQQISAITEIRTRNIKNVSVIIETGSWHEGILGIIAGKLLEEYKKPVFIFTEIDGVYKGSGRSFGEFNLAKALDACKDTIIGGGGHAEACGVKVKDDKMEDFRKKIYEYYESLGLINQERFLEQKEDIKQEDFSELTLDLVDELSQLEPYGEGNPEPVWLLKKAFVLEVTKLGSEEQHLRLEVRDRMGNNLKLIAFFAPKKWLDIRVGQEVDIWVTLTENEWNNLRSVEGRIVKIGVEEI